MELAPVYQARRSRRLTYDVRRKHARVELIRLSKRLNKEREALEVRARLLDIPIENEDGVLIHIDEEGQPHYSGSLGMCSCDTISTDEVWSTNATGQVNTYYNLSGAGITLAMWERGGINELHQEFAGRVADFAGGADKHANAVAAVMIGSGITNPAHGMAHAANLHAYDRTGGELAELTMVATNSPLSVLQLQTEWVDPGGSTNPVQFYKIKRTR